MDTGGLPEDSDAVVAAPDPLIGRHVGGKFLLERQLGAGAMGAVYRARQTALEKVVAIKVMHGDLARDKMFAARFHREAKAASRLDHPNSIRIIDYGQDQDGLLYIAMEYLDGRDLAGLLVDDWPLTNGRIVDLMSQALGAIAVAHDMGITHRDLKPENIMVLERTTDDGARIDVVKVCDFGIAKVADANDDVAATATQAKGKLTTAGLVIGTPAYMSPEQGRGDAIDARSDLYSMGVILYQLLTGQLPFDAPTALGLVVKHQTETPVPPSHVRPGTDPQLEAVTLKAMQKSPGERYQTARELRTAIRSAIEGGTSPNSYVLSSRDLGSGPRSLADAARNPAVSTAPTELQMVTAPTAAAPLLSAPGPVSANDQLAATPAKGSKAWLGVVGVLVVCVGGGLAWNAHGTVKFQADLSPPLPSATSVAVVPVPTAPTATASTASPMTMTAAPETPSRAQPTVATTTVRASAPSNPSKPTSASEPVKPEPVVAAVAAPEPPPPAVVTPPVVAAPVAPPAPVAPAAPAFDATTASVSIGAPTKHDGIGSSSVSGVFGHLKSKVTDCYRANLAGLSTPLDGTGSLHIEIDEDGHVTRARMNGPVQGAVGPCIQSLAMTLKFQPDTGGASADIPLEFKSR